MLARLVNNAYFVLIILFKEFDIILSSKCIRFFYSNKYSYKFSLSSFDS